MTKIEIILLILACLVPFFALIIMLNKKIFYIFKKKDKTKNVQAEPEKIKEEVEIVKEQPKQQPQRVQQFNNEISTDEFKSYLSNRQNELTRPIRKELPGDFQDRTMPYSAFVPRPKRNSAPPKPKNISEEIQQLSPELKALILSGVLDKKNYN